MKPNIDERKIVFGLIVVGVFQILWHTLLLVDTGFTRGMLSFYLEYNPVNRKPIAVWFDLVLPGCMLGLLIGLIGCQRSLERLAVWAVLAGVYLVLLQPIYYSILSLDKIPWEPLLLNDWNKRIWQQIGGSILTVTAFICGGCQMAADSEGGSKKEMTEGSQGLQDDEK